MTQKEFKQLKPGDKVRIVGKRTKCMNFCGEMDHWLDKIMTVREIIDNDAIRMKEDIGEHCGNGWRWNAEMIAHKIASTTKYEISVDIRGGKIIATYGKKIGIARCSPKDNFDELKGILIAVARMCGYELHSENHTKHLDYCLFGKTSFDDEESESIYELLPWKEAIKAIVGNSCYENNTIWNLNETNWENIRKQCVVVRSDFSENFEATDRDGYTWMIPARCVRRVRNSQNKE